MLGLRVARACASPGRLALASATSRLSTDRWASCRSSSGGGGGSAPHAHRTAGRSTHDCPSATRNMSTAAPPPRRGAFILFEGIDRSGKTTQCTKLVEHLDSMGVPCELWRFPDRTTTLGQMINSYLASDVDLNDQAVHLMFAANRWEKSQLMLETLARGTTLVVDRYSYSGMAYTLAKGLPGVDEAWCTSPEVGLPAPDVVFYMRTNAGASAARSGFGEERYERGDFQRAVAAQFEVLACGGNEGSAGRKGGFGEGKGVWVAVDATQPIDAIHAHVRSIVDELLANGGERLAAPVQRMQAVRSSGAGVCDAPGDAAAVVELRGAGAAGKGVPTQPQLQAQPREQQ